MRPAAVWVYQGNAELPTCLRTHYIRESEEGALKGRLFWDPAGASMWVAEWQSNVRLAAWAWTCSRGLGSSGCVNFRVTTGS